MLHHHELLQHDLPGKSPSLCVSVRARLGSILGLGAAAAPPPLALNCRSCTDAAFIYGALNESHIYYTDTGLTMGTG